MMHDGRRKEELRMKRALGPVLTSLLVNHDENPNGFVFAL
jgi:hypothetical protein